MLDLLTGGPKTASPPGSIDFLPPATTAEDEDYEVLFAEDLTGAAHFEPNVILMFGTRGKGKALGTTALGRFMYDAYRAKNVDVQVWANYNVDFASRCTPFLVDELNAFPPEARRKLVLLDEIVEFMPSARSMARSSLDFASVVRQIRKRDIDIIMNTQFPTEVDRRMLRQVDLFIEVELYRRRGGKADLKMYLYDYWGTWTGDWSLSKKAWPPRHEDATDVKWFLNVHTVFKQYNNKEVQAPIWSEHREQILEEEGWKITYLDDVDDEDEPAAAAPATLQSYLGSHIRTDGTLSVGLTFDGARAFVPAWKTRREYQEWLAGEGWHLQANGTGANNMVAFPPEGFTS